MIWGHPVPPYHHLYLVCDPADTRQGQFPTLLCLLESAGWAKESLDRIDLQSVKIDGDSWFARVDRHQNPFASLPAGMQVPVPAVGIGNLPQIVELKGQTGIAPGWLAFGSVRWTNWSVQETLDIRAASNGLMISRDRYYWDDGWTIMGGVGHAFSDTVSGAVSLTWDQGVGTGWDVQTDTWTLASGISAKDALGGEIRAGVAVSYLESGEETRYAAGLNSAVDNGWAYAATLSYKVKW